VFLLGCGVFRLLSVTLLGGRGQVGVAYRDDGKSEVRLGIIAHLDCPAA
jgi:hypothetical protein